MATIKRLTLHVKIISRSEGQSAIASAAYRSGEKLFDEKEKKSFDYSRKDGVLHTEIIAPAGAPEWATNRQTLWNRVEAAEKRKDAQLARDVIVAIPRGLDQDQRIALMCEFAQDSFVRHGMVADLAIHESEASDGNKNPHAHIMLTLREIDGDGFSRKKNREWNANKMVEEWRGSWEEHCNRHLKAAGIDDVIVSLQSFEKDGIDQEPTVHLGSKDSMLEEMGVETAKGNMNRKAKQQNKTQEIVQSLLDDDPWQEEDVQGAEILTENTGEIEADAAKQDQLLQAVANEVILYEAAAGSQAPASALSADYTKETVGYNVRHNSVLDNFTSEYKGRRDAGAVATPEADGQLDSEADREKQQRALLEYFRKTTQDSIRDQAELIRRIKEFARKSKELGISISEHFSTLANRMEKESERLRDKGYDR